MVLDSALAFLTFQVAVKVIRNFTQDSFEMCENPQYLEIPCTLSQAGSPLWEKDTSGVGVLKLTMPRPVTPVTFSIPGHPVRLMQQTSGSVPGGFVFFGF